MILIIHSLCCTYCGVPSITQKFDIQFGCQNVNPDYKFFFWREKIPEVPRYLINVTNVFNIFLKFTLFT